MTKLTVDKDMTGKREVRSKMTSTDRSPASLEGGLRLPPGVSDDLVEDNWTCSCA